MGHTHADWAKQALRVMLERVFRAAAVEHLRLADEARRLSEARK